jgi:hypothetical protein
MHRHGQVGFETLVGAGVAAVRTGALARRAGSDAPVPGGAAAR